MRRERRAPAESATSGGREDARATPVTALSPESPLVSVIVVCWNSQDVLGRCLDQLFAQDYARREIIVVDDGSDDATAQVAQQAAERGELTLVRSRRNRGCPSARNLGLRHANGEIVAFIDADGYATARWLGEVVAAFGDDARIGGVASTVFFDDNPMVVNGAGGTVNRQGWAADLSMNESYEVAQPAHEALYPMGCGMALRRAVVGRVGPFDDRMLNYYDDVDYGERLWRAGYRVVVAPDAWIDHGFGGAGGDSARKRLWCERHRMRVVLKHASARTLASWIGWEARTLWAASMPVRAQKLRSLAWNVRHLPSLLASRRRMRRAAPVPEELIVDAWGDGFPAGVSLRLAPRPEGASARVDMASADSVDQLVYGWFPPERVSGRSYRWAGTRAAALVHIAAPARRLRLDYAHVPVDIGGVDVAIRRAGSSDRLQSVWSTRLLWQYIARSVESHPLALAPGDYEVVFSAARGWADPPAETRSLALSLSSLSFEAAFAIADGGLDMSRADVEDQLVNGWFEAEQSPDRHYRWATGRAEAVVRLSAPSRSVRLSYCLPPSSIGSLRIALSPLEQPHEVFATDISWCDERWHEQVLETEELLPGDYLVAFQTRGTWSNPEGRDPALWGENRSLGFALSALSFG